MTEQVGFSPQEIPAGGGIVLRPVTVADSREMFTLIQSYPEHHGRFGDETAASNQVLEDTIAAVLNLRPDQRGYTVRKEGETVGYIQATLRSGIGWEIGGWVGKPYAGRGYMTRTVAALTRNLFETSRAARVFALTRKENNTSQAVLLTTGFVRIGEQNSDMPDHVFFVCNRPE
jgi:RimJ/RimL family protein N-acetyltransferase